MNEMRYAGHHLLAALDDTGAINNQEQLIKAHNHTKRACYEASEAGILSALAQIAEFKQTYSSVVIGDIVRNYIDILNDAENAKAVIETRNHQTEANGEGENTGQMESHSHDTDIYMLSFRKLKTHCHTLSLHRDDLNKRIATINEQTEKDRREARRFIWSVVWTVVLGIPAILLAAGTLWVAYMTWVKPHEPIPENPAITATPQIPRQSGTSAS